MKYVNRIPLFVVAIGLAAIVLAPTASAAPASPESTITVTLPTVELNPSVPSGNIILQPVVTTNIDASLHYVAFLGDFTFDSSVVSFDTQGAEKAGLTGGAGNWNITGHVINSGPGLIKTLRLEGTSIDFVPLSGSGTLFNLRMLRVSGSTGAASGLSWRPVPNQFQFQDDELNQFTPVQNNGLFTIGPPNPTPSATPGGTTTPSPTPTPTAAPTGTPNPALPTVSLPTAGFDPSVPSNSVILQPIATTTISASSNYIGFQGDFTFDSSIVSFSSPFIEGAGLTAGGNWNFSLSLLGSGPIKTARLSGISNDFTPLSGSGTLCNLRMVRVSGTPGAMSPLIWQIGPNVFQFVDGDLNTFVPNLSDGLITITALGSTPTPTPAGTSTPTPSATPTPAPTATAAPTASPPPGAPTVFLPIANFDTSVPTTTNILVPVAVSSVTPFPNPSPNPSPVAGDPGYVGFQGDFNFDSAIVTFQSPFIQPAGLTATNLNWHISLGLSPVSGTIKRARISAFSQDFTPLSGSGTLFNLVMRRVSNVSGSSSALVWQAPPNDFQFIDDQLNTFVPGQNNGLITITSVAPTPTPQPTLSISGTLPYCSSPSPNPVGNATLTLTGAGAGSTFSDGAGFYQFTSILPGGTYTVTPSKSGITPGSQAINTVDMVAMQRHFLQFVPLTGCKLIAADVTADNQVDTVDVVAIRQFFFAHPSANVGNYKFTPTSRTYPSISENKANQDYVVLVFGDVASPYAH